MLMIVNSSCSHQASESEAEATDDMLPVAVNMLGVRRPILNPDGRETIRKYRFEYGRRQAS